MQCQVGPPFTAPRPAFDSAAFRSQCRCDSFFSGGSVSPGRSRGNIPFTLQSLPQFLVAPADVFAERVSAALFVARQIIAFTVCPTIGGLGVCRRAPGINRALAPGLPTGLLPAAQQQ